jgi:hypothetical protein
VPGRAAEWQAAFAGDRRCQAILEVSCLMSGKKHPRASPHALREFKPGARKAGAFQIFQVSHLSPPEAPIDSRARSKHPSVVHRSGIYQTLNSKLPQRHAAHIVHATSL